MRLLAFSTLFPSAARPHHGIFVERRLAHLVASGRATAEVLAPVPWYPAWGPDLGSWRIHAEVAPLEKRSGMIVHHPRYPVLPRIGMSVAPGLLAAAALAWARRLPEIERRAFDVIDAHYVYPDGVAAVALARFLDRPLVITARGSDVTELPTHRLPRLMIRKALASADGLVAVSAALAAGLRELGADPAKIRVLRNGVDATLFRPSGDRDARRRALDVHGPTLLSAGHLVPRKGHDRVIEALALLPPACRLMIVGTGPEEPALRALAASLGLSERVRFLGLRAPHEMPALFEAADLLVLASSREGWANVLLEAMACGTSVVASPIPGNDEVVRAPEAGVIAAANDAPALAAAIAARLASPPCRSATRAYAVAHDWDEVSAGQLALFEGVAAAPRRPRRGGVR